MKRLAALTLLAGLLALNPGTAQDRKGPGPRQPDAPPPQGKRSLLTVRHADPAVLVPVLARHYKGQAEVSALPGGVLVTAPPDVLDELKQLVAQLDQKPRSVEVEITLADVPAKKGADGKEAEVDLSGNAGAKLDALVKAGQATVQRVRLTAIEGQPVTSTTGGDKPYTEGVVVAPAVGGPPGRPDRPAFGGVAQQRVSYRPAGTTVKMTARAGADDAIALDLNVQDSRIRPADGEETKAVAFNNDILSTHVSVPPGRAVVAQLIRTEGKAGTSVTVVLVTARVVEGTGAARNKTE